MRGARRSNSVSLKSAAADTGQVMVVAVLPWRSWIWMSPASLRTGSAARVTGTNSVVLVGVASVLLRASLR